jgi:hypothetical protein
LLAASLLLAAFAAPAAQAQAAAAERRTFALNLQNLELSDALLELHWKSGAPIVSCNTGVEARINVRASNLTIERALDLICEQASRRWQKSGRYYVLSPKGPSYGGLPPIEQHEGFLLYPETERLLAGRLLSRLDANQLWRLGSGEQLRFSDLWPAQQEMLASLYQDLQDYLAASGSEDSVALAARRKTLGPAENVAISLRTYVWRMEGPQQ